mgnify:CR=1 FL=1
MTINKENNKTDYDNICITPNCGKERKWKGLCNGCYGQAKKLIDSKETDWEELYLLGLCKLDYKAFLMPIQKQRRN